MDYRIKIRDCEYEEPYKVKKRRFGRRPVPNRLKEYVERMIKLGYSKRTIL